MIPIISILISSANSIKSSLHRKPKQYAMVYISQVKRITIRPTITIFEIRGLLKRELISGFNKKIMAKQKTGNKNIATLLAYQFTSKPFHCIGISWGKKK